jgi:TolB protein
MDGKKVAFSSQSFTSDIWSVPVSPSSNETPGNPLPLFQDRSLRKTNPVFSPDGKRIAFGVWRLGQPGNVWLMDADGKNPAQLLTGPSSSGLPGWLSNNDEVVYVARRPNGSELCSTNLKTGIERSLITLTSDMDFERLSRDGKELVFNSRKSGTINVWKIALDDGRPVQLTFDKQLMGFPIWSPDGRVIAFEMKRGDDTNIALIPSDGGEIRQLTFDHGQSWPHGWSPDGEMITFAGFRNGLWNIYSVSVKDGTQKQLTNFNKLNAYVRYPSWSPIGNQIVFEYSETTGNIWMMELR